MPLNIVQYLPRILYTWCYILSYYIERQLKLMIFYFFAMWKPVTGLRRCQPDPALPVPPLGIHLMVLADIYGHYLNPAFHRNCKMVLFYFYYVLFIRSTCTNKNFLHKPFGHYFSSSTILKEKEYRSSLCSHSLPVFNKTGRYG